MNGINGFGLRCGRLVTIEALCRARRDIDFLGEARLEVEDKRDQGI